jgi:hypothetical protein
MPFKSTHVIKMHVVKHHDALPSNEDEQEVVRRP